MIGSEMDLNSINMITKMIPIDTTLTVLKSVSVMSIRSAVSGPSPISIPPLSYLCRILFSSLIWTFSSSDATLYSELTRSSWYLSFFSISVTESGIILCGIAGPISASRPSAHLTPSTSSILLIIFATSTDSTELSTRIMCVVFMS